MRKVSPMYIILLSGGYGSRLWPMTNSSLPKQFLKILPSSPTSSEPSLSMFQYLWNMLESVKLTDKILISTSKSQENLIKSQVPSSIEMVYEPSCRDTYPAIALACLYLFSQKKVSPEETLLVLPIDTYAPLAFFNSLKTLEDILHTSQADLALMGIKPTSPSEKYGYILPLPTTTASPSSYQIVQRFIEKPSNSFSSLLIQQGALWNSGIFAFNLNFLLKYLKSNQIPLSYDYILSHYESLPKISFDYQVVEKNLHTVVHTYEGQWKDLGTWDALTQEITPALIGNARISSDCENIHIINKTDVPIAVLGLSNLIIIATPDGILITDSKSSSRVKEIL